MTQSLTFFPLGGGMDLVTAPIAAKAGKVIAALNYEPTAAGYQRLRGYQRTDAANPTNRVPLDQIAIVKVSFTAGDADLSGVTAGSFIQADGAPSSIGQYAAVAAAPVITSGSAGAGTAAGYILIALGNESSDWNATSSLYNEAGNRFATQSGALDTSPDLTGYDETTLLDVAREKLRDYVFLVPGSGPVRYIGKVPGAFGSIYAIRDNAGGTAGALHYAVGRNQADGWSEASLGYTVAFDQGGIDGVELIEGQPYDDASGVGGNLKVVQRFVVQSGDWSDGDAAGYLWVSSATGWASGDYIYHETTTDTLRRCRLAGNPVAITLPPGGEYHSVRHNFYGDTSTLRDYLVNGVGPALEVPTSPTFFMPIYTGTVPDTPIRVAEHKNSLFLAFAGGSTQFSVIGEPTSYDAVLGAGEIGLGAEIVDFASTQSSLAILCDSKVSALYGNDSTDYTLETISDEAGALAHTAQRLGTVIYMDNRGIRSLATTAAYGNFNIGTLSEAIEPLLRDFRRDGVEPVASLIVRSAGQYWVFLSNNTGIVAYMGRKVPEFLPVKLGFTVSCTCSVEVDGEERIYLGGTDGYVYEMNRGTSFDGDAIEHYVRLPFNHLGNPQQLKRVHEIVVELQANGTTTLSASLDFDYGSVQGLDAQQFVLTTGGGAIDDLGSNELYYASQIETTARVYVDGAAKNFSLKISGETRLEEPHTLTGATYYTSPRGLSR